MTTPKQPATEAGPCMCQAHQDARRLLSIEPSDLPQRVVVGANGAYWRDYGDHYSMPPVSEDNDPVEVVAVYEQAAGLLALREAARLLVDRWDEMNANIKRWSANGERPAGLIKQVDIAAAEQGLRAVLADTAPAAAEIEARIRADERAKWPEIEHGDDTYRALMLAVREADETFQKSGDAGTKTWLDDHFLPVLEDHRLVIALREQPATEPTIVDHVFGDIDR